MNTNTKVDTESLVGLQEALQKQIAFRRDIAVRAAMAGAIIGADVRALGKDKRAKAVAINMYCGASGDDVTEEVRAVLFEAFHVPAEYMPRR